MSTTLDSLKANPGTRIGISVQIEGYNRILCDADTDAGRTSCLKAYNNPANGSATDSVVSYASAVSGLQIDWENLRQEFTPWTHEFSPTSIRILVDDGPEDTFGAYVHNPESNAHRQYTITGAIAPGDTTFAILNGGDLSGTPVGTTHWLGAEAVRYTSSTSTTFTVGQRGIFAPFAAGTESNQRWARRYELPETGFDVGYKTTVNTGPQSWIGKWVAVRIHEITGEPHDTDNPDAWASWGTDYAHLAFAGKITGVQDTASGRTVLSCDDARATMNTATLFKRQYKGTIREGIYCPGWSVDITYYEGTSPTSTFTGTPETLSLAAGWYTHDELVQEINSWVDGLSTYTKPKPQLTLLWREQRPFYRLAVRDSVTSDDSLYLFLPIEAAFFLGFGRSTWNGQYEGRAAIWARAEGTEIALDSEPPFVRVAFQDWAGEDGQLVMDSSEGTWVSHGDLAPEPWRSGLEMDEVGADWGFLRIGKATYIVHRTDDLTFDKAYAPGDLQQALVGAEVAQGIDKNIAQGFLVGQRLGEEDLAAEQVVFLESDLKTILSMFLASTDGSGYNHATYDKLGAGLGVGIPWDLLGQKFLDSVETMIAQTVGGNLTIMVEKPTKFTDLVGSEILLRRSELIFKDAAYQFVTPAAPNNQITTETVSESTKGAPRLSVSDAQRTVTETTSKWLRNVVKLEYNRNYVDNKYRDSITVRNQESINIYGEAPPVTIKCRNHYSGVALGDTITNMAAGVASYLVPVFGAAIRMFRRTINHNDFHLCPGDPVLVTDDYARDPATGTRGLTSKAGMIVAVSHSWGSEGEDPTGEIEILLEDFDRAKIYAPCGDVDDTKTNSGLVLSDTLQIYPNRYSDSSEDDDITRFTAGDVVDIVSVDDAPGVTPLAWTRTINTVTNGSHQMEFTADVNSPAWDDSRYYRVFPSNYSACQTSQQTNYAFQADDADLRVEDTIDPRWWATYRPQTAVTRSDWDGPDNRPELNVDNEHTRGDGVALTPAHVLNLAKFSNNGNSYKSAQQFPFLLAQETGIEDQNQGLGMLCTPLFFAPRNAEDRTITIAPIARVSSIDPGTLDIYFSTELPTHTTATDTTNPPVGRVAHLQWTGITNTTYSVLAQKTAPLVRAPGQRGLVFMTVIGTIDGTFLYFKGLQYATLNERTNY